MDADIKPAGESPAGSPVAGWYARQYCGFEVYKLPDPALGLSDAETFDDRSWPRDGAGAPLHLKPITDRNGLKPGDRVIRKGNPFDHAWNEGVIQADLSVLRDDRAVSGILDFAADDRRCWTCGAVLNDRAVLRADFC